MHYRAYPSPANTNFYRQHSNKPRTKMKCQQIITTRAHFTVGVTDKISKWH